MQRSLDQELPPRGRKHEERNPLGPRLANEPDPPLMHVINPRPPDAARICVIIPFFNEEKYIGETLASLADQALHPASMLLIDNGSTDHSVEVCLAFAKAHKEIAINVLHEVRPAKIYALETACRYIDAEFAAFCDADTIYPRHYLQLAAELFAEGTDDLVAVMAVGISDGPYANHSLFTRFKSYFVAALLAKQCHAGGFGQVFKASAFLKAGGYSAARWPYVLEDHEVVQRLLKLGRARYHPDFYCMPSPRRADRTRVTWTMLERIVYHCTPFCLKDWYFRRFLAPRLAGRGQINERLRER